MQPGDQIITDDRWREKGRFAIVIPLYNHADMITRVIEQAKGLHVPIVVVDDGSTDASFERIKDIGGIHIIRHPRNMGKGAALMSAMNFIADKADWAIAFDADGQHTPRDAIRLVQALPQRGRSLVVGVRQGMDADDVHWTSRFGRRFSNFWVWASCGKWIADTQTGFRLYPLPETLDLKVRARRYQFEVEVLVKAVWHRIPVVQAPVSVDYRPGAKRISHFRPFVDFIRNSKTFGRLIIQRIFIPPAHRRRK